MWKAGLDVKNAPKKTDDDDWETDGDFVNDISEKEQRWGSKIVGSGKEVDKVDTKKLAEQVAQKHDEKKKEEYYQKPTYAHGYGGKFGVQTDRVDKAAVSSEEKTTPVGSVYQKAQIHSSSVGASNIKSKFETSNNAYEEEQRRKVEIEAERKRRAAELDAQRRVESEQKRKADEQERRAREEQEERKRKQEEERKASAAEARRRKEQEEQERRRREEEEAQAAQYQQEQQYEEPAQHYEEPAQYYEEPQQHYEEPQQHYEEPQHHYEEPAQQAGGSNTARALYEYEAAEDNELSFQVGDIIENVEFIDDGWWSGTVNGNSGLFPSNYVELI